MGLGNSQKNATLNDNPASLQGTQKGGTLKNTEFSSAPSLVAINSQKTEQAIVTPQVEGKPLVILSPPPPSWGAHSRGFTFCWRTIIVCTTRVTDNLNLGLTLISHELIQD